MSFQALLVSKDEEATGILKPVFAGFGVDVQTCSYPEAVVRITEQRFDAVVVDFDDPHSATLVLQNLLAVGRAPVTIALLSDQTKVRNVFGAGANFVLYKPIAHAQAQASLRAATALIKRERRRSFRVPVQVPVRLSVENGPEMEGILLDLSEDGMDVLAAQPLCPAASINAHFTLLDGTEFDLRGEVAWANPNGQSGVRLIDLSEKLRAALKTWVASNAPELPPEDPQPVSHCQLTDLSLGACYVQTESPFPEQSGIVLTLKAGELEVCAEGVVRVMHPGYGMGIEFASGTSEEREHVEHFIDFLTSQPGTIPELLITPRALKSRNQSSTEQVEQLEDPLLELLRHNEDLSQEQFLDELRKQRRSEAVASQ
jgi:CheY-like chemotaxis protein